MQGETLVSVSTFAYGSSFLGSTGSQAMQAISKVHSDRSGVRPLMEPHRSVQDKERAPAHVDNCQRTATAEFAAAHYPLFDF